MEEMQEALKGNYKLFFKFYTYILLDIKHNINLHIYVPNVWLVNLKQLRKLL